MRRLCSSIRSRADSHRRVKGATEGTSGTKLGPTPARGRGVPFRTLRPHYISRRRDPERSIAMATTKKKSVPSTSRSSSPV